MSFGLIKATQYPLAIDFGVGSLKVLQLAPGEPPAIVVAGAVPTPDELIADPGARLQFQYEALPALLKDLGVKTRRAVCSVSSSHTLVQHFHLPKGANTPVRNQVLEALQATFQCDPAQLVLRHFDVGEITHRGTRCLEVIAIAMPGSVIQSHMRALRACKLEVAGIHTEHIAALRAFDYLLEEETSEEEQATICIDVGYGTTKVVVSHDGKPAFARTIKIGGADLDVEAAEQTEAPVSELRRSRIATDDVSDAERSRLVDALAAEVSQCMQYHSALFPGRSIARAIFCGGETTALPLTVELAEAIGLPSHRADPFQRLNADAVMDRGSVDFNAPQPGWVTPVGLSLAPADA